MKRFIYLVIILPLFPFYSFAHGLSEDLVELDLDELMQIEVTSVSKKSEKLSEAAAAVYVVTDDEIRRSGAASIPEALRLAPGVDAAQIDPNKWAVSIRGFNGRFSNKLLVLIDGRSVYTPTHSGVYWEYLDYLMTDIARIEVIRGPGATLWGTNAVNGVINIITREAGEDPGGALYLAAGNEYQGVGLRQGGDISENAQLRVYAKGKRLDESQNINGEGQDNGGDYLQTGFRLDVQPKENKWLTLQGDLYKEKLGEQHAFPTFEAPYNNEIVNDDIDALGGNLAFRWGMQTSIDSELAIKLSYDFYDHQDVKYGDKRDTFNIDLQHQFSPFTDHDLVLGAGYRLSKNDFTASQYIDVADASNSSEIWNLFVQDSIHFPKHNINLTLGSKLEDNNYSGTELQPNIRASWVASEQLTWWAAISRATRTPSRADTESIVYAGMNTSTIYNEETDTFVDIPTLTIVSGSENFQSEQLDAYEFGVRWMPMSQLSFDLATFYNDYKKLRSYDIASFTYPSASTPYAVLNLELSNNIEGYGRGFELLTTWQASPRTRFRFIYSLLDIELEDAQENNYSNILISMMSERSAKHQLSLSGSFDVSEAIALDARLHYTSERRWGDAVIDATANADLSLGWQAMPSLALSLVGRNLLHSSEQEFITESWSSPSAIERSIFLKGIWSW